MKKILFFLIISSFSCTKKPVEPVYVEHCPGDYLDYGIDSIWSDPSPFSNDSIQITEVNGIDVTHLDTVKLNSFCDVDIRVKNSPGGKVTNFTVNSDGQGNWLLDTSGLSQKAILNFHAGNLNGFTYTWDIIRLKFYYNTPNRYVESKTICIMKEN